MKIDLVVPSKALACLCGQLADAELIIGAVRLSLCVDCLDGINSLYSAALIGPLVMPRLVIPHYYDKMPKERERIFEAAKARVNVQSS